MFSLKKSMVILSIGIACLVPSFSADAATIALLPVINQSDMLVDEANGVFFDRAIEALKKNGVYELVDDEKVDKAISKYYKEGVLPDQTVLQNIANEAGVDAVVCYQIEELKGEDSYWGMEWSYKVHLSGRVAAYNTLAKKVNMSNRVFEDVERPQSESARFDIAKEVFANSVTREIKRVIGDKKFRFEKPHISKAGQKGNR